MAKFYAAEVRNVKDDPSKSGRVKVRIYGRHNDEQNIKDDDLPWALPLMPAHSASTNGFGILPAGMVVGTRCVVTFLEDDISEQYPIILGTFYRAQKAEE